MKYLSKSPYTKATGISLLIHGALIVCLAMLGPPNPVATSADSAAIEVVLLPADVVDATPFVPPDSPLPAPTERPVSKLAPVKAYTESLPLAMPGETSVTSVPAAVVSGTAAVGQTTAVGGDGDKSNTGIGGTNNQVRAGRTAPAYLDGSKPIYPQAARKAKWEGNVIVRALIDTDGSVESVAVRESSGYEVLDEAAIRAVKKWHFSPAKTGGVPIASFHDVRVRFRLDEAE